MTSPSQALSVSKWQAQLLATQKQRLSHWGMGAPLHSRVLRYGALDPLSSQFPQNGKSGPPQPGPLTSPRPREQTTSNSFIQKVLPSRHAGFRERHAMLRVSGLRKSKALSCSVPRPCEPQAPPPSLHSPHQLQKGPGKGQVASWVWHRSRAGSATVRLAGS